MRNTRPCGATPAGGDDESRDKTEGNVRRFTPASYSGPLSTAFGGDSRPRQCKHSLGQMHSNHSNWSPAQLSVRNWNNNLRYEIKLRDEFVSHTRSERNGKPLMLLLGFWWKRTFLSYRIEWQLTTYNPSSDFKPKTGATVAMFTCTNFHQSEWTESNSRSVYMYSKHCHRIQISVYTFTLKLCARALRLMSYRPHLRRRECELARRITRVNTAPRVCPSDFRIRLRKQSDSSIGLEKEQTTPSNPIEISFGSSLIGLTEVFTWTFFVFF